MFSQAVVVGHGHYGGAPGYLSAGSRPARCHTPMAQAPPTLAVEIDTSPQRASLKDNSETMETRCYHCTPLCHCAQAVAELTGESSGVSSSRLSSNIKIKCIHYLTLPFKICSLLHSRCNEQPAVTQTVSPFS